MVHYAGPVRLVQRLKPRHKHDKPGKQLPRTLPDQCCVSFHYTSVVNVVQRMLYELFQMIQSVSNSGVELVWRSDEIEEALCVILHRGEMSELR